MENAHITHLIMLRNGECLTHWADRYVQVESANSQILRLDTAIHDLRRHLFQKPFHHLSTQAQARPPCNESADVGQSSLLLSFRLTNHHIRGAAKRRGGTISSYRRISRSLPSRVSIRTVTSDLPDQALTWASAPLPFPLTNHIVPGRRDYILTP